jgi:hypothetical protein
MVKILYSSCAQNISYFIEYDIEKIDIIRGIDDNMKPNVNIQYKPETDVILNINEIDNIKIIDVFDRPILNKNIYLPSEYSSNPYFNDITELLNSHDIFLTEKDMEKISNVQTWRNIKIGTNNITLYFYKVHDQFFKLFVIEYENSNYVYDYNIKIGTEREKIIKRFGKPTYSSDNENIYIYSSLKTSRQINLFFDNDKLIKIQLVSWGGI